MSYNVVFPTISSVDSKEALLASDSVYHSVYFNKSSATSLKVEAQILGKIWVEVASAQTTDYETYALCGVTMWRITPTGGSCAPYVVGV